MSHSETIYRLGSWIATHQPGVLRLAWPEGELLLTIRNGKIVSVVGPNPRKLARMLGPGIRLDETDLMISARLAAEQHAIRVEESVGAVKAIIQEELAAWLCSPERELQFLEENPDPGPDPNVSFQHALIELILTAEADVFSRHILPDHSDLLRRHSAFSRNYASLGLSEEADLVVSQVDGQRSIRDILKKSSLPEGEVLRLLSALTCTGILEVAREEKKPSVNPVEKELEVTVMPVEAEVEAKAVRMNRSMLLTAAGALILFLGTLGWFFFFRHGSEVPPAPAGEHWGIVVDLACEPADYRRMIQTASRRKDVLALPTGEADSSEQCWRLVWGDFPEKQKAEAALDQIPAPLRHEGFASHVIKYEPSATDRGRP